MRIVRQGAPLLHVVGGVATWCPRPSSGQQQAGVEGRNVLHWSSLTVPLTVCCLLDPQGAHDTQWGRGFAFWKQEVGAEDVRGAPLDDVAH